MMLAGSSARLRVKATPRAMVAPALGPGFHRLALSPFPASRITSVIRALFFVLGPVEVRFQRAGERTVHNRLGGAGRGPIVPGRSA